MNECVFCRIVAGEIPAAKVYEDDLTYAFLDLHPINPGQSLVIPKIHVDSVFDLTDEHYQAVFAASKVLGVKIQKALNPARVGILIEGFDIPHVHVKVIPMNGNGDIISGKHGHTMPPESSLEERQELAKKIAEA